tara:strand:+ start:1117 stop:1314 length:198 start_codon:yes stop_codon:yes gene_type:complete
MKHFIEIHWLQKDESILSKMSEDVMFLDINGSLTKDERVTIETILDNAIERNRKKQKEFYKNLVL